MKRTGEPLYKSRPVEPNAARFKALRINDFVLQCEAFSNSYLLQTPAGNIQINAGMGFEAPVIQQSYAAFTHEPVTHLIFTQGHVDHVGGTAWLREQYPGLQVIAQAGNPEHQAYDGRLHTFRGSRSAFAFAGKFQDTFAYYAQQDYSVFPAQDVPQADLLFEGLHAFVHGGLQVELIAVPGAETNDSLIVWLPQHKICLTGNLFGCPFGHFPNLVTIRGDRYRDALVCAAAAETVRALEPELILYGHHGPVAGAALIQQELSVLRDAILFVHDAVVEGMNAGKTVHTLMAEVVLPPELEVGEGYGKVAWSVRAIWENYAGWFHHSSTTELYAVPASAVNADLVELAGGVEPLVARAEQKLLAQHTEQALHLLDIVLACVPDHEPARALSRRAHTALLEKSENFWLSAWLRHQIQQLTLPPSTAAQADYRESNT
ncbi:MAG: MBL fold metallo-hydrolase [Haliea sp.]|nr:MBL fold metallo-hydrolase [Haliea sp.]MDP5065124.1 MBL fold metallo-hydrolase [Haliea sp.]